MTLFSVPKSSLEILCALAAAAACTSAAQAQAPLAVPTPPAASTALVTLNARQAPVAEALRTLFAGGGVRNFVIDPDVQGRVNLRLSGVPFSVALKQVLGAVTPALAADVEDGITHVRVAPASYAEVRLRHYDAAQMAGLITRPDGIIDVPPNFVFAANAAPPGPAAPVPAGPGQPAGVRPATRGAATVLPDGISRIFALQSNNSLVLEGNTP